MKKLKIKLKGLLLVKIAKYRKEIKAYKDRIANDVLLHQELIDKINLMQDDIRQLLLKLPKEERELWLRERNRENERHTPKKKRLNGKI